MQARAILFTGEWQAALGETEIPDPGPGEVLLRAEYTCVSPGTELRCLAGKQWGAAPWPFIPGYALVGAVVRGGAGTSLAAGTRVLCAGTSRAAHGRTWGGHVEYAVQPEVRVFPLPAPLGSLEASVLPLAAIAYHGTRLSRPQPGEQVAVAGLGPIGQLAARVHALAGACVVAADLHPARCALAAAAGIQAVTPGPQPGDLAAALLARLPGGADIVIDATGAPGVLGEAMEAGRDLPYDDADRVGPRVLVQGSYPEVFPVAYRPAFQREVQLLVPRNYQARDLHAVIDLAASGRLVVRDLISEVRPAADAPAVYAGLRAPADSGYMTVAFAWEA